MSSYRRYKEPPATEKVNILDSGIDLNLSNFVDLYSAGIGWSSVTQKRAGDSVVRNREWFIDFKTGILRFGMERYPFQIIGTESAPGGTWLWSWANSSIENEDVLALSDRLYSFGEEWGLNAFCEPQFELTQLYNGFSLSAVASMLSEKPVCFYRCPHETGSVFVTFGLVPKNIFDPVSADFFISVIMRLMQLAVADHKIMAEGFLFHNRTPFRYCNGMLIAEFPGNSEIKISFDHYHRITKLSRE